MKPITSLLLIVAIICYVFLPLFEYKMIDKDMTGLTFTIDSITNGTHVFVALLPFLATFLGIGFNSLKNRYWGIAVVAVIIMGLYFFPAVRFFSGMPLADTPEVVQDAEFHEGMPIADIGLGFRASFIALVLALVSALISLMPLKINRFIEESIDNRIEEGKKHLHHLTHDKKHHHDEEKEVKEETAKPEIPEPEEEKKPPHQPTDHSAYMPH